MNMKIYINCLFVLAAFCSCSNKPKTIKNDILDQKNKLIINTKKNVIEIQQPEESEDDTVIDLSRQIINQSKKQSKNSNRIFYLNWTEIIEDIVMPLGKSYFQSPQELSFYYTNRSKIKMVKNLPYGYESIYDSHGLLSCFYNPEKNYGNGGYEWYFYDENNRILCLIESFNKEGTEQVSLQRNFEYSYDEQNDKLIVYEIYMEEAIREIRETHYNSSIKLEIFESTSDLRKDKEEWKKPYITAIASLNDNNTIESVILNKKNETEYKIEYTYSKEKLKTKKIFFKHNDMKTFLPLYDIEICSDAETSNSKMHTTKYDITKKDSSEIIYESTKTIVERDAYGNATLVYDINNITGKETAYQNVIEYKDN